MYYSRTGKPRGRFKNVKKLSSLDKKNSKAFIGYYWNLFDELDDNISLFDCLDDMNLKILCKHESNTLHIDYQYEIVSLTDRNSLTNFLLTNYLPPRQVKIYVQDALQKRFFLQALPKYKESFEIFPRHYLTVSRKPYRTEMPMKNFSVFCRRHTRDRLRFFFQLYRNKILDNSHWSYQCIDPNDNENTVGVRYGNKKFDRVLPKRITEKDKASNQDHNAVYTALANSYLNIIIETVFDQTNYTNLESYDYSSMPTDISEKTFKAVSQRKPFVVFATPYWLSDFRSMGFKTFAPFIDESYDLVENNDKRMELIVRELVKLNGLSTKYLQKIINDCEEAVEHNYLVWKNMVNQYRHLTTYVDNI